MGMVGKVDDNLMLKLLELLPEESMSVHQIACKTSLDYRTIKKYIALIVRVQNSPRLRVETVGLRVLVKLEK